MLDLLHSLKDDAGSDDDAAPAASELAPLRMLAAPMLLLTGIEATLESLRRVQSSETDTEDQGRRAGSRASYAAVWAPSLLAPFAAAAQMAHLSRPSESVSIASRVLNTAVVGAGVGAMADMLVGYWQRKEPPSLAPLALTAAGLLAMLLDRQQHQLEADRRRLEQRARIVERLVPKRRAKLDRIVVHV